MLRGRSPRSPLAVAFTAQLLLPLLAGAASGGGEGPLALVEAPEVLWTSAAVRVESEPLWLDGRVLVAGRDPGGRRALAVLAAEDGRVLARTLFATTQALDVAHAGERVAARLTPERVELFRLRGARLVHERSFLHAGSLSAPRLEADALTLREGGELVRYDLARQEPLWRARLPGAIHGAPELGADGIYAGWYDAGGSAHLARIDAASGALLADVPLGRHRAGVPADRDGLRIALHDDLAFVRLAAALPSTAGRELSWARVPLGDARLGAPTLHEFASAPAEVSPGWAAPEITAEGALRWLLARRGADGPAVLELASATHHAWLCASATPAASAGSVIYLGPCAFDARTLAVLWRRAKGPDFRPVPTPQGLLWVEDGVLRLLGPPERARAPAADPARELVLARERALGERLAEIALAALRIGDGELAERLAEEAEALGASGRSLALVQSEARRGRPPFAGPQAARRRATLETQEAAARAGFLDELAGAARLASDAGLKRALLQELFRRSPAHAGGIETLAELLGRGARPGPGETRAWCEFLEVAAERAIERLDEPAPGSPEGARLASERGAWRADARAFASERILVVTAGASPGAVARAMVAGELVCDVLARLFGGERPAAEPLHVVLYPTREEYLARSGSDLGGLETVLGFTAGHFDLAGQVSRLYLPPDDADEARLRCVSAHELTHHWLALRSPLGPPRATNETRGFWIVEGIATWIEELRIDARRGTFRFDPARAASLDTVANAGAHLLPWGELLAANFEDYRRLETRPVANLALDWQLGVEAPRSPMQLFYAQAAALAHYLHEAEGGAQRALLLDAVAAFQRGAPLDLARALGTGPDELGRRVVAWATRASEASTP
jgi:hypothetical protein